MGLFWQTRWKVCGLRFLFRLVTVPIVKCTYWKGEIFILFSVHLRVQKEYKGF